MKTTPIIEEGDSFQACLATLFELPPEQCPVAPQQFTEQTLMDTLFEFMRPLGCYPYAFMEFTREQLDFFRGKYLLGGMRAGRREFVIGQSRAAIVYDPMVVAGLSNVEDPFHPNFVCIAVKLL